MINYFDYSYAAPTDETPFSTAMAATACPWNPAHKLLRVGLQGRIPDAESDQPVNLVFLLDVSGSMNSADKLPLLKKGFNMMVNQLAQMTAWPSSPMPAPPDWYSTPHPPPTRKPSSTR